MIKLLENKKKCIFKPTDAFLPHEVIVPFKQENFDDCKFVVKQGDKIEEGQVIAKDSDSVNHPFAAEIHSSIPGTIGEICNITFPNGDKGDAIKIKLSGTFSFRGKEEKHFNWKISKPENLINSISKFGVINTFFINTPRSLASQIKSIRTEVSKVFIVRLFDEDPSRCTDSFLTATEFEKIRIGAAILQKMMAAPGVVFVYDKNKKSPENKEIDASLFGDVPVKYVGVNCKYYPVGYHRELVKEVLQNSLEEPFSKINILNLVVDALTLLHVYNAIELHKPVISQYVHISGNCLNASGVFRLPLGMRLDFLVEQCGGFIKNPNKVIVNGQLTGWSITDKKVPITKYVKSIAFEHSSSLPLITPKKCVKCGKCRTVCPAKIFPDILYNAAQYGIETVKPLYIKSSTLCSGCTLCNAVCSSRLPLKQIIERLKENSYEKLAK